MKKLTSLSLVFGIAFGILSANFAHAECTTLKVRSWRGCEPTVETIGTISTDKYSAVVSASWSSAGADYNGEDTPSLMIEYGRVSGGVFDKTSDVKLLRKDEPVTKSFLLTGLDDGQRYAYRAVLTWPGGIKRGEVKSFDAVKKLTAAPVVTTPTTTNSNIPATTGNTTTTTTDNTLVYSAQPKNTSTLGGLLGGSKDTTTKSNSGFSNVANQSGFRLAIDNGETKVNQGDTITIKVRYENNNTKSADNSSVDIYLAPQYTFVSTTKGIYDRIDNKVSIDLREFPGGGFGTAEVTAKATAKSGDLDQAVSQAALRTPKVTLKVSDVDEYVGGNSSSGSVLGASAAGAGFLPKSIIGWLILLIVLAAIVIIGRRYFIKKDY